MKHPAVIGLCMMVGGCGLLGNPQLDDVRRQLRDGQSAQFSDVQTKDGKTCGLVNGKNLYGAYTGNKLFAVDEYGVHFGSDAMQVSTMNPGLCSHEAFMQQLNSDIAEIGNATP